MAALPDAYPLSWPVGWKRTPRFRRKPAPYKVGFGRARDDLIHSLELLRARDVVLSSHLRTRLDGYPLAKQREPDDPGVAVYWIDRDGRPRVMACDKWDRVKDNVRALGLAIEAFRMLERTGASEILDRAFTGFAALPAEARQRTWREVLCLVDRHPVDREDVEIAYRTLARTRHPDRGGRPEEMVELNRARDQALREIGCR